MDWLAQLLFFAAIAAVFYFLLIRPNVRRQRQVTAMQEALRVGDQIMLTSGFFGVLQTLEEDRVVVELAPGTSVTVARGAVASVVPPAEGNDSIDTVRPTDAEEG